MCFHSKQTKDAQTLEKRFKAKLKDTNMADKVTSSHFNGFDFPKTPIITNLDHKTIQLFEWGLIPEWTKEDINRSFTLNARIETLDEKPSYKHHKTHRCLVLADGFYEWKWLNKSGTKKEKYEVGIEGGELFAFAGIWSEWISSSTHETIQSYSIVTTEAQRVMREIHNTKLRMPIILRPEQEKIWLEGGDTKDFIDNKVEYKAICLNPNLQQSLF